MTDRPPKPTKRRRRSTPPKQSGAAEDAPDRPRPPSKGRTKSRTKRAAATRKPSTRRPANKKAKTTRPQHADRARWPRWMAIAVGASVCAIACVVAGFIIMPGPGSGKPVTLMWKPPASAGQAADRLERAGLVRSSLLMALYLRLDGHWDAIEPGSHLLQDDMSPRTLLRRLQRLPGGAAVRVPIPEGFHKLDVAERLESKGVCSARGLIEATTNEALLEELHVPAPDAEGYLFPATYEFARNHAPDDVVRRLVNESTKRHARIFGQHAGAVTQLEADLGWSRHSLVVLASIVEKEAAVDEERPIIASVFLNRMYSDTFRPRQRLQSDPTARYGCLLQPEVTPTCMGAADGVTGPMVRDPLNPYSTYAHPGLPPGPICNPGARSLKAVLHPADTDYFYFVAKGGGRHAFSETYDEHRAAIRRGKTPKQPRK